MPVTAFLASFIKARGLMKPPPGNVALPREITAPLASYRDRLVMLTGLDLDPAKPLPGEGNGDHARAGGAFLTAAHPKKTEGTDLQAGVSMDQLAARELGKDTQIGSLEMTMEYTEMLGACDAGYSCAYSNTISWQIGRAHV